MRQIIFRRTPKLERLVEELAQKSEVDQALQDGADNLSIEELQLLESHHGGEGLIDKLMQRSQAMLKQEHQKQKSQEQEGQRQKAGSKGAEPVPQQKRSRVSGGEHRKQKGTVAPTKAAAVEPTPETDV